AQALPPARPPAQPGPCLLHFPARECSQQLWRAQPCCPAGGAASRGHLPCAASADGNQPQPAGHQRPAPTPFCPAACTC
uniref:Uncharacterized protein n=1 Tax=Pelusios castaneus TaxID=367368 RepID=A0A8C8RE70_9SAUR